MYYITRLFKFSFLGLSIFLNIHLFGQGSITYHKSFPSEYIAARDVEVWLPQGYNPNRAEPYPVLYMHDGQNVFNPETSYTKVDWGVDEALDTLIDQGKVPATIVVAVWNTKLRNAEYVPNLEEPSTEMAELNQIMAFRMGSPLISDKYLKFLVEELKPFIDKTYHTSKRSEDTAIMGSSLGGLISLYAFCEFPEVFGKAACVSTHWPIPIIGDGMYNYLKKKLPPPNKHRVYFDRGTEQLDASYQPWQMRVDLLMQMKGYKENLHWLTKVYPGAGHNEASWGKRLDQILPFLLN